MKLVLIRHGLTDYNLNKRYSGFRDISLNKIGRAQAKEIKIKLKGLKIDKVFCSDLKRSWETTKIIFGHKGPTIVKNKNLREINFGRWEGLNFKQILKKYSFIYKKWLKDPFSIDIPGGEGMIHFTNRIRKELKNIIKDNAHKTVAIVGHSGSMRIILNTILEIKRNDFWRLEFDPRAIYVIEYKSLLKPKVYKL
jgi:broad specificity phosphatase PhoE